MGILGNLAGNTSNLKKCKWCGRTYDAYESYASTTSFCSEKCEKEYGDDRFGPSDDPELETVDRDRTKLNLINKNNGIGLQDELYDEVVEFITSYQKISVSMLQRKFTIGRNRAQRIMDQLEKEIKVYPIDLNKEYQVLLF